MRAAGDIGCYRRELYKRLKCDKKTLDAVVDTLIDNGLAFHDWRQNSAGKLIHADTDAGMQAYEHAQDKANAQLRAGEQPWRRS